MDASVPLTVDSLVTLRSDIEPYVLEWPEGEHGEHAELLILVAQTRPGGFLAVVPIGTVPEEVLAVGNSSNPPGPVGPSTVFVVPSQVLDNGTLSPTGSEVAVLVVDMSEVVLSQMHVPVPFSQLQFTFDQEQPFAVPSPMDLLTKIQAWLEAGGDSAGLGYVTAEGEDLDGLPLSDGGSFASSGARGRGSGSHTASHTKAQKTSSKTSSAWARKAYAWRKEAHSSLFGRFPFNSLIHANTGLTQQVQTFGFTSAATGKERHCSIHRPACSSAAPQPAYLFSPASSACADFLGGLGDWTSPKNSCSYFAGTVAVSLDSSLQRLQNWRRRKQMPLPSSSNDHLAQAVLAQSKALTALVSQIASQGSDPMLELGAVGFGAGTRGAQGRAKLQAELSAQRGTFFNAVLSAMARRMQPTSPTEGSPEELMARGICGTRYLERFGGYGKHRELGCFQHQVMTTLDFLQVGNLQAARDSAALMAVVWTRLPWTMGVSI